ncbi:MAG: MMPL family transporter [Nitrospinae bacterium]|nr:MMPL family transporter [Nitrospinota bacterium]
MKLDRYIDAVLRHRWLVVALAVLILLITGAGGRFIKTTNDYRIMFGKDNPQLAAFRALEKTFSTSDTALIAVAPRRGSVFTKEALGALEELTQTAWKTPHSSRVDSLTNYNHSRAEGDDLIVEPLVEDAGSLTETDVSRIRKIALGATEIAGRLVSNDGRVGGLAITFNLPENQDLAVREITDYLNVVLQKAHAKHPDIAYYMTGTVVVNRSFQDAPQAENKVLLPIVLLVIVSLTIILLRSFLGTLAIMTVIIFPIVTAMGFAGWVGAVFSPTNAGVPVIIMVIAIADAVHIVSSTLFGMRRGLEKDAAIAESIRINAWPVFLTSLTTAIGFLSLNTSDSPPFHVLGNCVTLGVLCALAYSLTLLPALLSILPLRAPRRRTKGLDLFERFADFVISWRKFLLVFFSLAVILLLTGIPRIELGDDLTKFFDERYRVRRDTDYISQHLTGFDKLEYSLKAGREGGITDPVYLRKVEAFAEWYRKQPKVTHVQAFPNVLKRLNKNMHGDDPAFYRIPDDPKLAAQYLLLYEFSLPFGMDLNNRIDVGKTATRMTVTVQGVSARGLRALDMRAQTWLRANIPEFAAEASGISMIFAHLTQRNMKSMLRGTFIGMTLISIILILVFKNVRLGLISLVPNFIPAAMTFGLWGYLVSRVSLAASVMTIIAFGIIVDDTIHFLSKYLKSRREGLTAPEAVGTVFRTVGHALWTTTVVLSAGFLMFTLSGYEGSWTLGLMVSITIIFGLLTDFLLLPTLLMALDRKKL